MDHLVEVKRRLWKEIANIEGVQGIGIGELDNGESCIFIYLLNGADSTKVPSEFEDVPVKIEWTEGFVAL